MLRIMLGSLLSLLMISGGASVSPTFHASFPDAPAPFIIDVDRAFIDETIQKVKLTRLPVDIDQPALLDGPPVHNATTIRDYWLNHYDWFAIQHELNSQFNHSTTTIHLPPEIYSAPLPLHFIHHLSPHPHAIPLLFLHGWPGSFLELGPLLPYLLSTPSPSSQPAFHVIAPSVPGFGFSPAPTKPGFGYIEAAHAFHALMRKLGYEKYVIQGGDLGGIVMRYQAHAYPEAVVSGLSNFWVVSPEEEDLERYRAGGGTGDERALVERLGGFVREMWGYGQIQMTRPLRLAYGLTDSPVGLAMWVYDALWPSVWDRGVWTAKEVITWTMMFWIQGPYGGMSIYKQGGSIGGAFNATHFHPLPYVKQPMAASQFPMDLWYRTPLEWMQRTGNVKVRYMHETGGHFPAWENPELLAGDIWSFFGDEELSNTKVFHSKQGALVDGREL